MPARASALFDKILDEEEEEEEEGLDLSAPDRCGWTGLDMATCLGLEREAGRLAKMGRGPRRCGEGSDQVE